MVEVTFAAGGDAVPDPALVAHAREIVASFEDFQARIEAFLAAESAAWRDDGYDDWAIEIAALELEHISCASPPAPKTE